jgi:hypothetical protein
VGRVREYLSGLVAGLERQNGWTLAERAGEVSPDGMQRLLRHADWDARDVRDDVRDHVTEHLGDPGGVLIADETGFIKKGTCAARNTMRPGDLWVLGGQAAWVYSLIRPLRTGLRRICCLSTSVTIAQGASRGLR